MLSLPHLIVIFVVALVIFGPEKLPELARILGKATGEFRRITTDFRFALEQEVRDLDRQVRIREEEQHATQGTPPGQPVGVPIITPAANTQPRELRAGEEGQAAAPQQEPKIPTQDNANVSSAVAPPQDKSPEDHAA